MKNHFLAQKYRDQYFLFDYYNLCLIQTDKELYNCAVDYLSGGQSISSIEEIRNTSFSPYAEDLIYLLEQNILISNSALNCDIIKTYPKVYFSFPTVHACNLRCKYCFAEAGSNYKEDIRTMSEEQIENIFRFLLSCEEFKESSKFRLDFVSGGEPLLNFDLIKSSRRIGDEIFKEYGKLLDIWLCTNGILLDEEKAGFLNEHNIGIGVSLDGAREINDMYRLYPDNGSSYEDVVNSISQVTRNKAYNRYFRDIWILTVVTAKTSSLIDILEHHKRLGLNNVQMKIVRSVRDREYALTAENAKHFISLYSDLTDFIIDKLENDDISYLKMFLNGNDYFGKIIIRLILREAAVYRCMAGRNKICFAANGDIYPCDSFVGQEAFRLGNISYGFDKEKVEMFYNQIIFKREPCRDCWANIICGGDCYHNSYLKNSDIRKPDEAFCEVSRELCMLAIRLTAYLSFEKPDLLEKLYQYLEKRKAFQ